MKKYLVKRVTFPLVGNLYFNGIHVQFLQCNIYFTNLQIYTKVQVTQFLKHLLLYIVTRFTGKKKKISEI